MTQSKLSIVARIFVKEGKLDLVKNELLKLIEPTRAEKGCINYDLHQDHENDHLFFYLENWETRELWQDHMATDHIVAYMKATEGALEDFIVNEMTQIG